MKKAYIISTGTELLLGSTLDTNSVYISERLHEIGIRVIGKSVVGDNENTIKQAFNNAMELADIVISSGGLGPTFDDLTKTIACEVMNTRLELRDEEVAKLKDFFTRSHRQMPEINLKQAMFPPEAIVLKNPIGTAPGMYLDMNNKVIALLPGPPREMKEMYQNQLEPLLKKDFQLDKNKAAVKTLKVLGLGESQVEEILADIIKNPAGCSMALMAKAGEIHIRVTAEGCNVEHSENILAQLTDKIINLLGNYIYGFDDDTLQQITSQMVRDSGKKIAFAESCTGGLLSKMITDLPGSSEYFWGSVISYSNGAKVKLLGVKEQTLDTFGAVSEQTAREMAFGIINKSGADIGAAITGIAGPDGGTPEKPVGLVYIAVAEARECKVKELHFVGPRDAVRVLSAKSALDMVRKHLAGY